MPEQTAIFTGSADEYSLQPSQAEFQPALVRPAGRQPARVEFAPRKSKLTSLPPCGGGPGWGAARISAVRPQPSPGVCGLATQEPPPARDRATSPARGEGSHS